MSRILLSIQNLHLQNSTNIKNDDIVKAAEFDDCYSTGEKLRVMDAMMRNRMAFMARHKTLSRV